jgi:outer membrane protein OmpA-like peptidoglycan-associated protein
MASVDEAITMGGDLNDWTKKWGPQPRDGENSRRWAIAKLSSHGAFGGDESYFDLVNRDTGRAHRMRVLNFGLKTARLPVSGDFTASDYVDFTTSRPANFEDFDGKGAELEQKAYVVFSKNYLTVWDGPYGSSRGMLVRSVKIKNWGPSLPGHLYGRGVTSILWGPGSAVSGIWPGTVTNEAREEGIPPTMRSVTVTRYGADEFTLEFPSELLFPFDRPKPGDPWVFDAKAEEILTAMAKLIKASPGRPTKVFGYTDSIGPDDYNLALSARRAAAVAQWLTTKGGVKSVDAEGLGNSDPKVPNTDRSPTKANIDAQARNRRIELWLYPRRR